ncbi:alpha-1,2-fucosyltransferase [Chryseobacterium aquaticum]|uniref:alpha-1,2-fucosyltransferase n=1 Tax=Chryseobacterium aquaticum TaxID=452084 RepID=UPI002FC7717D
MIAIELIGGLGNQMFQYAAAKALALHHNEDILIDKRLFASYELHNYSLNHFNIKALFLEEKIVFNPSFSDRVKAVISGKKIFKKYQEDDLSYDESFFKTPHRNIYLKGYFQSEKYFIRYEDQIRKEFEITAPLKQQTFDMLNVIGSVNSVSLHIRRGDYVTNSEANAVHGTCDLNYYHRAIDSINKKIENAVFFIFSDDIDWAKQNLKTINKTYFVDFNDASTNYEDIKLMSNCKHNIIANSSFSWWGAWLNRNKGKIVIAPKKWFNTDAHNSKDILPESWLKI